MFSSLISIGLTKPHTYSDLTLLAVSGNCIIHMHQWLYYSWVMILLFILQLINLLFMCQACLLSPAESGGHSGEFGVSAGCSARCHRRPEVAPSFGQRRKDICEYPGRSWAKRPVLKWPHLTKSVTSMQYISLKCLLTLYVHQKWFFNKSWSQSALFIIHPFSKSLLLQSLAAAFWR